MEEPEIIKMLKYILLISALLSSGVGGHPLVTEPTSVVPVPIQHSGEQYSEIVPSLIAASSGGSGTVSGDENVVKMMEEGAGGMMRMSPVGHISELIQDELVLNNQTGGQKHVRQIQQEGGPGEGGPVPPNSPPPSDELCSIFQFFLEPRRYSRCRVNNVDAERNEALPSSAPVGQSEFDFPPPPLPPPGNFQTPGSNEVVPQPPEQSNERDNFHSESENRQLHLPLPPRMNVNRREDNGNVMEASKRYDQLDEHIHGGGPPPDEIGHHHHHHHFIGPPPPPPPPPPGPPPMFPKSSLDRTTIIVPERPCRRGERRDHKGYCRRIVRPQPSYQYGPPPPPYGPSRPFRYYYSRFVSVPTLQFFIPSGSL